MIAESAISQLFSARKIFEPVVDLGLQEWSIRYVFNEQKRAFDHLAFPHIVQVGGPMDAFGSHWIREVVMQWASRLGKTFTTFCALLQECDLRPSHMMAVGPQMKLSIANAIRIKTMLEQIPHIARTIPSVTKQERLEFGANVIHAAWARSPATLSDRNIQFGAANEFDLFEHLDTKDAPDPEKMFIDRFKDNWTTRKIGFESIPLIRGKSRVERRRLTGSDCRFWVPCQNCFTYQVLQSDLCSVDGYQCYKCDCLNDESHRLQMMRSGVWVPDGCEVDSVKALKAATERMDLLNELVALPVKDERCEPLRKALEWHGWSETDYLIGDPIRDNHVASYQLSSMYALKLTWAEFADQNDGSQNFVNQWEGETFEVVEDEEYDIEIEAKKLAKRVKITPNELPDWSEIVTLSCDRQLKDYPWWLTAWSYDLTQSRILDAGRAGEIGDLMGIAEAAEPSIFGIDSGGFDTKTIYDFVMRIKRVGIAKAYPVKGSSNQMEPDYELHKIKDKRVVARKYSSLRLCMVNTASTQAWIDPILEQLEFCEGLTDDLIPILIELLNDQPKPGKRAASNIYTKRDASFPNDFRDCLRYSYSLAQVYRDYMIRSEMIRTGKRSASQKKARPQRVRKPKTVAPTEDQKSGFQLVGPSDMDSILEALNR